MTTLAFIPALLKATRPLQERFHAQQIPVEFFPTHQAEIKWIYEYRERHGVYPNKTHFLSRFPETPWVVDKQPLTTHISSLLETRTFEEITEIVKRGREMYEGGRRVPDVLEYFRRSFSEVRLYDLEYIDATLEDDSVLREYREKVRQISKGIRKAPSPWASFNRLVGFDEPGEMVTIAARTSIGKTWLSIFWAAYLFSIGERVLFVSKELPTRQIKQRFEALFCQVSYSGLRHGNLSPVELRRWVMNRQRWKKIVNTENLLITGTETMKGVGFSHILQKIQEFRPTRLFVDGAYLIYPETKTPDERQRFALISSTLKRYSMAFGMVCYPIIQARRDAEANSVSGATNAKLGDLYGSDAWAQDSDYVLVVNGKRASDFRTILLEKSREGETGQWSTEFKLNPWPRFQELEGRSKLSGTKSVKFIGI